MVGAEMTEISVQSQNEGKSIEDVEGAGGHATFFYSLMSEEWAT